MHMVGRATNHDGKTFLLFATPGQMGMSLLPEGVVQQIEPAPLALMVSSAEESSALLEIRTDQ